MSNQSLADMQEDRCDFSENLAIDLVREFAEIDAICAAAADRPRHERLPACQIDDAALDRMFAPLLQQVQQPPRPAMCKKSNGAKRQSLLADRQFLREYKALTGISLGRVPHRVGTIMVSSSSSISPSSLPTIFPEYDPKHPALKIWTRTPSRWREASDEVQGHFSHEAIQALGPAIGVSTHLDEEINAAAYTTGKPLLFLRKRIADALRRALGRPIEFLLTLEEEFDRLRCISVAHLHGELAIDPANRRDLALARKALRTACGEWTGSSRNRQCRFSYKPDAGWISYCLKDAWLAAPAMRAFFEKIGASRNYRLSHAGPVLTMTNGVRAKAKLLHEEARKIVQEARTRPSAPTESPTPAEPLPAAGELPSASKNHSKGYPLFRHGPADPIALKFLSINGRRPKPLESIAQRSRGPPKDKSKLIDVYQSLKSWCCNLSSGIA